MRRALPPPVYFLFVLLTGAQLGLFVLSGALGHVSTHGAELMLALILALAFRSRIVWGLLVLIDGIPLFGVVASLGMGGQTLWGHVAVMLLTGVALEATLLSSPMRQFVGHRGARAHPSRRVLTDR